MWMSVSSDALIGVMLLCASSCEIRSSDVTRVGRIIFVIMCMSPSLTNLLFREHINNWNTQGRPSLQADHADCVGPHLAQGASTEPQMQRNYALMPRN